MHVIRTGMLNQLAAKLMQQIGCKLQDIDYQVGLSGSV